MHMFMRSILHVPSSGVGQLSTTSSDREFHKHKHKYKTVSTDRQANGLTDWLTD